MRFEGAVERGELQKYGESLLRVTNLKDLSDVATVVDCFKHLDDAGYIWRDVVELRVDDRDLYYFIVERGYGGSYDLFGNLKELYKGSNDIDWLSTLTAGGLVSDYTRGPTDREPLEYVDDEENTGLLVDDSSATGLTEDGSLVLRVLSSGILIRVEGEPKTIGRSHNKSDVAIPGNKNLSRVHCEVYARAGKTYIRDMGSVNRVYINGKVIDAHQTSEIKASDQIHLADEEILVE